MVRNLRPLLLVDVDGVISLFGYDHAAPPAGRYQLVDGMIHFLSATAGEHLLRLAAEFDLAWCTGWEEKANDYLPVALGLPGSLPHVMFDPAGRPAHAHWKLGGIDRHVGPSRPIAWLDDAHDEGCRSWALARPGPTLLSPPTRRSASPTARWKSCSSGLGGCRNREHRR